MSGRRRRFELETVDLLMIWVLAVPFGVTFLLLLFFPKCWPWFLWLLDVRIWPPWKCIGFVVAIAESLVVIRLWPTKRRRRA